MRHEIELDSAGRIVVVRYHGEVTLAEIEVLFSRMTALPGWAPDFARLIFYDDGQFGDFTVERMNDMLRDVRAWRDGAFEGDVPPTAHVCADEVKRIFVKHWLAVIQGVDAAEQADIFEEESSARAWIEAQRAAGRTQPAAGKTQPAAGQTQPAKGEA